MQNVPYSGRCRRGSELMTRPADGWTIRLAGSLPMRAALVLCCVVCLSAGANAQGISDAAVKAAYLSHFGSYVEWPASRGADRSITIGVIGDRAILSELRLLLQGNPAQERRMQVRSVSTQDDLEDVHILYVGNTLRSFPHRLIEEAREKSVLVITDIPDGLERGGMINFVLDRRRVRFEISRTAAERAKLKLSSRLLAVAIRVRSSRTVSFGPIVARVDTSSCTDVRS